ncbi:MAG: hypothetical protein AAGL69_07600 [Pseudomonadota bacterium]
MTNRLIAAIAALLLTQTAFAQAGKIELKTVVEKEAVVLNEAGQEVTQLVPADKVVPGDVVIYTVTYTNVADEAVENVVITNPIADQLQYVTDSAFAPGADIEFSVDGGQQFAALESLTVERDGELVPARTDDLTHIRWTLTEQLDPGAQGFARFRARLN